VAGVGISAVPRAGVGISADRARAGVGISADRARARAGVGKALGRGRAGSKKGGQAIRANWHE